MKGIFILINTILCVIGLAVACISAYLCTVEQDSLLRVAFAIMIGLSSVLILLTVRRITLTNTNGTNLN